MMATNLNSLRSQNGSQSCHTASIKIQFAWITNKKHALDSEFFMNFRPITQFPSFFKTVQRLVYRQLIKYLEGKNLLDSRDQHSYETALVYIVDFVLHSMDQGRVTFLIYWI
jgi:hypothetical protein